MTAPLNNLTDTWNNGATVFTGLKYNITNTASAAGSELFDFQIGGTSKVLALIGGQIQSGQDSTSGSFVAGYSFTADSSSGYYRNTTGRQGFLQGGHPIFWGLAFEGVTINAEMYYGISGSGWGGNDGSSDTRFYRDDAYIFAQRNSTNAQTFRVYNTTDAGNNNYERGVFDWTTTANVLTIGTQVLGTGTIRGLVLTVGTTGNRVSLQDAGNPILFDAAASGAGSLAYWLRDGGGGTVLHVYAGGDVVIGTTAAIATNATDGFLYIPTCAGTPSGTPRSFTGKVAMVYDTTNNKFYIYNGAWKGGTNPGVFT